VLNITWDIDEPSLKLLNDDRDSRRVIGDLVGEFLTNAVKHGKAHQVSIWMRPTSRGTMDVSLYNDGAPLPKDRVPGLGTELAYSVSTSVRLPPRKTGVEVRLEIPCEGFGAHAQSASRRTTTVE
jgi:two-component sensor histidine kinase